MPNENEQKIYFNLFGFPMTKNAIIILVAVLIVLGVVGYYQERTSTKKFCAEIANKEARGWIPDFDKYYDRCLKIQGIE